MREIYQYKTWDSDAEWNNLIHTMVDGKVVCTQNVGPQSDYVNLTRVGDGLYIDHFGRKIHFDSNYKELVVQVPTSLTVENSYSIVGNNEDLVSTTRNPALDRKGVLVPGEGIGAMGLVSIEDCLCIGYENRYEEGASIFLSMDYGRITGSMRASEATEVVEFIVTESGEVEGFYVVCVNRLPAGGYKMTLPDKSKFPYEVVALCATEDGGIRGAEVCKR